MDNDFIPPERLSDLFPSLRPKQKSLDRSDFPHKVSIDEANCANVAGYLFTPSVAIEWMDDMEWLRDEDYYISLNDVMFRDSTRAAMFKLRWG